MITIKNLMNIIIVASNDQFGFKCYPMRKQYYLTLITFE
jgi:hypothetical protein